MRSSIFSLQPNPQRLQKLNSHIRYFRRLDIPILYQTSTLGNRTKLSQKKSNVPSCDIKLKLTPPALVILIALAIATFSSMAASPLLSMPTFLSRFLRPFTTSTSLSYNPESVSVQNLPANTQKATVAAGCFWGVEHLFRRKFGNGNGLLEARVGYTGSKDADNSPPSYRSVCSGKTGHAEALQIHFDPDKVTYRSLLEFFFNMHDPTTMNRQGYDTGSQYRSAIFAHDEVQLAIAKEVKEKVGKHWWKNSPVVTEVTMAGPWYDAEDYHQLYLHNNPGGYECAAHRDYGFGPLPE